MGIDIYALPDGQLEEAQMEAWLSTDAGRIGYLREAYHGEPYATRHLMPEVFMSEDGAYIAAATLRNPNSHYNLGRLFSFRLRL